MKKAIAAVRGRRVWDSRARPTVEVEVALADGVTGRAIAPAGASKGSGEALDLRDGGQEFGGHDVRRAVASVNEEIAQALVGMDAADQAAIDAHLVALDGTASKARLGANALIATSMAAAHAAAASSRLPLWRHLAGDHAPGCLPLPEIQIFGGGAHAGRRLDIQDFMVIAVGADDYPTALDWTARVYHAAGDIMSDDGLLHGVADEGGFWPAFDTNEAALDKLVRAIERAGLRPGEEVAISLDVAASDFGHNGRYRLAREGRDLESLEFVQMLLDWTARYPIVSIEDPLAEDDPSGMAQFTKAAGRRVQVVGDDFVVTDPARIQQAAKEGCCNAALIKPNQIGTLSEAKRAADTALSAGWGRIASARSGESEDVTIVHLAVGWAISQLKVGSIARSERNAKWNEGLRLAETLPSEAALPPRKSFLWG